MLTQIMQDVALCDDFSYAFDGNMFRVFDHSEGNGITLSYLELIELVSACVAGDDDSVTEYDRAIAVNIVANHKATGLASFIIGLMP